MTCLNFANVLWAGGKTQLIAIKRDERGSPVFEFAFAGPAFIAMIIAVLNVSLIYLAQEGLETAAEASARLIMTGQAQKYSGTTSGGATYTGMTQADFLAAACKTLPPFLTCNRLSVDVTTVNSFSAAVTGAQTLTYNSNGTISNTFSYAPGISNGTAAQTQIVVLRLTYLWPVGTGPLGFNLAGEQGGNHKLTSSSVLLTENY